MAAVPPPGQTVAPVTMTREAINEANMTAPFLLCAQKLQPKLPWPDISARAKWSVSSSKLGFGVECLLDNDPDTFWHSDGPQPHFITIEFPRKTQIQKLCIYLSHPQDDSYTPSTLAIRAGTGSSDLQDVRIITLDKPDGWITFDVSSEQNEDGDGLKPVNAYVVQIIIMANHQSGKDTHVRGVRALGPQEESDPLDEDYFRFTSTAFNMYKGIR
ncbi:anaphase-promoting complex, subunit 10 [Cylindrobasidium torrendii FP15055 ss-10]|uniref:Anaphase-promoting complex subunit 10 n=1 Tax=Cylindrobasidium torrendii FP15055 ss-10 TaxID=1314674 RepID=A0A0D7B074_9AGAR|nr:anaphase-promoting complex, subunit 10 [Cylindrobasidium torrendii FP15055 ss-10]